MMHKTLYLSAITGNKDGELSRNRDQFEVQLTPNGNSVLHLAAFYGHTQSVNEILNFTPSLLHGVNIQGETPLHFAVKGGDVATIEALVAHVLGASGEVAKEILKATNGDGNNALHMAVQHRHVDVVGLLLGYVGDDEVFCAPNKDGESPLYMASEMGLEQAVVRILEACSSPSHAGPLGRTALHASVILNSQGITQKLLEWNVRLSKEGDENGWPPLHYAASLGRVEMVQQLLHFDTSLSYLTSKDQDDKKTALHIAAARGDMQVVDTILSMCPDCGEMVNGRGQNILHLAVMHNREKVITLILETLSLSSLINQKDSDGNTPAHMLASSNCYSIDLIQDWRLEKIVFNKEHMTPWDVACSDKSTEVWPQMIKRDLRKVNAHIGGRKLVTLKDEVAEVIRKQAEDWSVEDIRNVGNTHLIVAALVATVAFAAGFTVPGGYNSNNGMAILVKEAAFKAFVATDTMAFILSSSAVVTHLLVSWDYYKSKDKLAKHYTIASIMILVAVAAMVLAFVTGVYVMLPHSSALAIYVCVIGCFFFLVYYYEFKSVIRYAITYNV